MMIPRAIAFLLVTAVLGCGEKGACEYPGNQCDNYTKSDCKSGTFTAAKTCSDLGYQCPSGGGICKK